MAKKPRPAKWRSSQRFIALPHYMLKSPAWKTLSPNAKALLIEVWARHNGFNNGTISYSVREAEEIGISYSTAARAFSELIDRGFLRVRRDSRFTQKTREARLWEITAEQCDGNKAAADFVRWQAPRDSKTQLQQRDTQLQGCNRASVDEI